MTTKQIKDRRAELKEKMQDIVKTMEREGRDKSTPQETKIFEKLEAESKALKTKLSQAMKLEKDAATNAVPLDRKGAGAELLKGFKEAEQSGTGASVPINIDLRAVLTSDGSGVAGQATEQLSTAPAIYMQPTSNTSIFNKISWIEAQNNRVYPYVDKDNRISAQHQTDQTSQITPSASTVSSFTTEFKNYYSMVNVHNDVLRDASPGAVEQMILQICREAIGVTFLDELLYSDGTSGTVTGLANMSGVQTIASGATSVADYTALLKSKYVLEAENVDFANASVLMSPGISYQYAGLTTATEGLPLTPPKALDPLFMNDGWHTSTVIRDENGVGDNKIFVGRWDEIKVYYEPQVTIRLQERFADYDQTSFLVIFRADVRMFHPEQMAIITGYRKANVT